MKFSPGSCGTERAKKIAEKIYATVSNKHLTPSLRQCKMTQERSFLLRKERKNAATLKCLFPCFKNKAKTKVKTIHLKNIDNDTHTESGTEHKDAGKELSQSKHSRNHQHKELEVCQHLESFAVISFPSACPPVNKRNPLTFL